MKRHFSAIVAGSLAMLGLAAGAATTTVEPYTPVQAKAAVAPPTRSHQAKAKRVKPVVLGTPAANSLPPQPTSRFGVPLQIGFGRAVPGFERDAAAALEWDKTEAGTLVGALSINSPDAAAIRVGVVVETLPAEAMLRFYTHYDETLFEVSGREILDMIARNVAAGDDSDDAHTFWSPPIDASTVVMEIELPAAARPSQVRIGVPQITHMVTSAGRNFEMPRATGTVQASAACELDAMCSTATWGTQMNAVARMQFNVGASGFYCTGTLLGNTSGTATPNFLTAKHCISTQTAATTLVTDWFLRSALCGSATPGTTVQLSGGATLLYTTLTSPYTDTTLLRLNSAPPAGAAFAGWQVSSVPTLGTGITGLHHPQGDLLKIAGGTVIDYQACTTPSGGMFSCTPGSGFYMTNWSSGITEPGSSGSALFQNSGKYVIGQLYGGSSACGSSANDDFYGRLDIAYNAGMDQFLNPALPAFSLTVSKSGPGAGTVTSAPAGITCGTSCSGFFTQDTTVTLTATPSPGSLFSGWSGACTAASGPCLVTMTGPQSVTATFTPMPPVTLGVSVVGSGTGSVTSSPAGISCGATCSALFPAASTVMLTATPSGLSTFVGWSGACTGMGACSVTMNSASSVTAEFGPPPQITVTKAGTGGGTVTSTPAGISCGATCNAPFTPNNIITLTAVADAGSMFTGWSGACTGGRGCSLTMNASKAVTATFNVAASRGTSYTLAVTLGGTGTGAVTSNPAGISCGLTCSAMMAANVAVTLTAAPSGGSTFAGWGGACSGTGSCIVPMSAATSVTATFTAAPVTNPTLTIVKTGTGSGTIASVPAGIACGATCTGSFAPGTLVRLTATPDVGSTFGTWSGCTVARGSCTITLSANATVTVSFNGSGTPPPTTQTLNVSVTGSGSVASSPAGISCGATCSAAFTTGTPVTLTPTAGSGATFTGWSGACTGTGACVVTMNAAASVTAAFTTPPPPPGSSLTVVKAGINAAGGLVTSNVPAGIINCGATCTASVASGTSVTLSAMSPIGGTFGGWTGCSSARGTICMVSVTGAKSVTATFN